MEFMWIAPNRALDLPQVMKSRFNMVLPEPFEISAPYHNFMRDAPGFKVLDNGMFETGDPIPYQRLVGYAHLIRADEIILPDVAGDQKRTEHMVARFLDEWAIQPKTLHVDLAAVVQGSDENQLKASAETYLMKEAIGTIMIPKRVGQKDGSLRGRIAQHIHNVSGRKVQIHFLGLNQEHARREVEAAMTTGVRSIDCTHPFKCAMVNISVNHPRAGEIPRRPGEYWNAWMDPRQLLIAQNNIEAMYDWIR